MPLLYTTTTTIHSLAPRAFVVRDLAHATLQTLGAQTLQLMAIRKGTLVVNCWVDVLTAAGAAGTASLNTQVYPGGDVISVLTFNENVTGLSRGPITATGYDPITADGHFQITKNGLGTNFVCSLFALFLRPDMNP